MALAAWTPTTTRPRPPPNSYRVASVAHVNELEVLLLWRALRRFRSGKSAACAPRGKPLRSECPLFDACDRWSGPDDYALSLEEDSESTERRRASWPCSRLLQLLGPDLHRLGDGSP